MNVSLDIQDGVALITMDDGKKNAITLDAIANLDIALDKAEADAGAVVLAGRPGSFCAGFHLATLMGTDKESARALGDAGARMVIRLWGFGKPLVAACTGHAFTIGAIWMAACDTRIGERGPFTLGMNETKLGMGLSPWALEPLKTRISRRHWIPSIVQSRMYDPEGALEAGFLDELVPEGQAVTRACALAGELAQLPAEAYATNKLVTRQGSLEIMIAGLEGR